MLCCLAIDGSRDHCDGIGDRPADSQGQSRITRRKRLRTSLLRIALTARSNRITLLSLVHPRKFEGYGLR